MKSSIMIICCVYILLDQTFAIVKHNRKERAFVYPGPESRSLIGLFIAIAVPVDLPVKNVFVSYNAEGNYYLPYNISELHLNPFYSMVEHSRSIDRNMTYNMLESQLIRLGYAGRPCLLRSICEASEVNFFGNGILGDIAHIILTPSSSLDENISPTFYNAEKNGKEGRCDSYIEQCPSSFLDSISKILHK